MIYFQTNSGKLSQEEVFRRWILREVPKEQYPDADPSDWDTTHLLHELEESYEEPAEAAARGSPNWFSITVDGAEIGKFDAFPACGWDELSENGTIRKVVDRLQSENIKDEFPKAVSKISEFKRMYPEQDFGAIVARQYDGDWPPILLEGNHRACAAHWASRQGVSVELTVHIGTKQQLSEYPLQQR